MDMPTAPDTHSPEMMAAMGVFGKMLSIASVYGMNHPSLERPLKEAHRTLTEVLDREKKVAIGLFNQTLTINDKMITSYTVHLRALQRRLISLDAPHLVFQSGVSAEELRKLIGVLCQGGSQTETIQERLAAANLNNIKASKVEYVAQHEGQHLVGDEEETDDGKKNGDKKEKESAPTIQIDQIVAFLKGAPSASGEAPSEDLQQMLSDPEQLAQLIMDSVSIRQSMQSVDGGESLADVVLGCLRRTYSELGEQKKFQSTRGKKSLHKAMLLLEQTVVDKIREAIGEDQPEIDEQILNALKEAEEQRQVEILAARYADQHKKTTQLEMDIREYVKEHGEEKARQIMDVTNADEQQWSTLQVELGGEPHAAHGGGKEVGGQGGGNTGGESGDAGESGVADLNMGALAIVLDKIDTIMHLADAPPEIAHDTIEQVRDAVQETAEKFEDRIETLEAKVQQHETADKNNPETREKRANILLEISQIALKLAQPLTVISASIETAMNVGEQEFQKDLLEMAHEAAERMKNLMARLTKLVGYPSLQDADKNSLLYD